MQNTSFTAKIDYNILSTTTAKFQGDCQQFIKTARENLCDRIELDLTAVASVDSRGLDSLVGFAKLTTSHSMKIHAQIAHPFVAQIFKLTRIEQFLPYTVVPHPKSIPKD
jgi:anti-anti-sigma regulatory factor